MAALLTTDGPLGVSGVSEAARPALVMYGKGTDVSPEMTPSQMTGSKLTLGEVTPCKVTYASGIVKVSSATLWGLR
jgi:hypothetical protein